MTILTLPRNEWSPFDKLLIGAGKVFDGYIASSIYG